MSLKELVGKILILGETKVGKSSILKRFTEKEFLQNIPPTLGIDYKIKNIVVGEYSLKMQIWDTAGQERFKSITEGFYKGCHGVLLVFDLTDTESFNRIKSWIESIRNKASEEVVICLVGNKLDLKNQEGIEVVKQEEIDTLVNNNNL